MAEFKMIETQEQLDEIIKNRLDRQKETLTKDFEEEREELEKSIRSEYSDYKELQDANKTLKEQVDSFNETQETLNNQINELNGKINGYETKETKLRIAREFNIPYELADRLRGDDEELLKEDATNLSELIKKNEPSAPSVNREPNFNTNTLDNAYLNMAENISQGD